MSEVPVLVGNVLINYQQVIDYASTTTNYYGVAPPGTAQSDARWQIRRETLDSQGRTTNIQFANGSINLDQTWTTRASQTYS